jgi:hypothetical protein
MLGWGCAGRPAVAYGGWAGDPRCCCICVAGDTRARAKRRHTRSCGADTPVQLCCIGYVEYLGIAGAALLSSGGKLQRASCACGILNENNVTGGGEALGRGAVTLGWCWQGNVVKWQMSQLMQDRTGAGAATDNG